MSARSLRAKADDARACLKIIETMDDEFNGADDDPMTDYYGAWGIVADAHQRACERVARRFGFSCVDEAIEIERRDRR